MRKAIVSRDAANRSMPSLWCDVSSSVPGVDSAPPPLAESAAPTTPAPRALVLDADAAFTAEDDDEEEEEAAAAAAALGRCVLVEVVPLSLKLAIDDAPPPSMLCDSLCSGRLLPSSRLMSSRTESRSRWMLDVEEEYAPLDPSLTPGGVRVSGVARDELVCFGGVSRRLVYRVVAAMLWGGIPPPPPV